MHFYNFSDCQLDLSYYEKLGGTFIGPYANLVFLFSSSVILNSCVTPANPEKRKCVRAAEIWKRCRLKRNEKGGQDLRIEFGIRDFVASVKNVARQLRHLGIIVVSIL